MGFGRGALLGLLLSSDSGHPPSCPVLASLTRIEARRHTRGPASIIGLLGASFRTVTRRSFPPESFLVAGSHAPLARRRQEESRERGLPRAERERALRDRPDVGSAPACRCSSSSMHRRERDGCHPAGDVEAGLPRHGERLQGERAAGSADERIGAEPGAGGGLSPHARVGSR